jgi:hypothetical protein
MLLCSYSVQVDSGVAMLYELMCRLIIAQLSQPLYGIVLRSLFVS